MGHNLLQDLNSPGNSHLSIIFLFMFVHNIIHGHWSSVVQNDWFSGLCYWSSNDWCVGWTTDGWAIQAKSAAVETWVDAGGVSDTAAVHTESLWLVARDVWYVWGLSCWCNNLSWWSHLKQSLRISHRGHCSQWPWVECTGIILIRQEVSGSS